MLPVERRGPGGRYLAQVSAIPALLSGACVASKALLKCVGSGRQELPNAAHVAQIGNTLAVLDVESGPLAAPGAEKSALFVALLYSINAAVRWPAGQTLEEVQAETAARSLCMIAIQRAREMFGFDAHGDFLKDPRQRNEAVAFTTALLQSNALQSLLQRLEETSASALDLLRHQQQQQQHDGQQQRPMGLEGAVDAAGSSGGMPSSSSNISSSSGSAGRWYGGSGGNGAGRLSPQKALEQHRERLERWLPVFEELGETLLTTSMHDPGPGVGHMSCGGRRSAAAAAAAGADTRAAHRPPPARQLLNEAMSNSRAVEHAARAVAALALLKAATRAEQQQQQQRDSPPYAGGGAAGGVGSSWAIEACAAFLQHLRCASYEIPPPQSVGGSSSRSSAPASHSPGSPKPPPYGPCSRYVLTWLGLRCLHGLDGGSCYGMPRELVCGLPPLVAPDRGNRQNPNVDEFERGALDSVRAACCRIETLVTMVDLLKLALAPRRCGKGFQGVPSVKGGASASEEHGNSGSSSGARQGRGRVGVWAVEDGTMPVAGPGAARDIARRIVGWTVGVARGWAADEERRAREGGGGRARVAAAAAAGGVRQGSIGVQLDGKEHKLLSVGHQTVAVLAVEAVKLHFVALGCVSGVGGAAPGAEAEVGARSAEAGTRQQPEEGEEQEKEGEQQQVPLKAEWYGLACNVASRAVRWTVRENVSRSLATLMALQLPHISEEGRLPLRPPPRLAAALSGGYLPCLETLLRRCGRYAARGDVSMLYRLLLRDHHDSAGGGDDDSSGGRPTCSHDLPWLLAYGNPRQSASLLASMAKLVRRAMDSGYGVLGNGGGGGAAPCIAADSRHAAEGRALLVDELASTLCSNLGATFAWMQDTPHTRSYDRAAGGDRGSGAAAGASAPGPAARFPPGPARLQLLLSFALARLVPPLSELTAWRCKQLLLLKGRGAGGSRGREQEEAEAARHRSALTTSLAPLLVLMAIAMGTVWSCKESARRAQRATVGPSSSGGSSSRSARGTDSTPAEAEATAAGAGASVVVGTEATSPASSGAEMSAVRASGVAGTEGTAAAATGGAGTGARLSAVADDLQGLLDGDADMAGLVGATLDCLQLLPDDTGGWVAATILDLVMCCLRSCVHDMVGGAPLGVAVNWSAASPTVRQVITSRQPGKLRAAAAAARAAGYAASALAGDTLVEIAEGYVAGRPLPEEVLREQRVLWPPLWLLGPVEVGRELGCSCCCNARCTRLEGDSEAGEGQGRGLLVCGSCRGAWYCCRECQAADWAAGHKKQCKAK